MEELRNLKDALKDKEGITKEVCSRCEGSSFCTACGRCQQCDHCIACGNCLNNEIIRNRGFLCERCE